MGGKRARLQCCLPTTLRPAMTTTASPPRKRCSTSSWTTSQRRPTPQKTRRQMSRPDPAEAQQKRALDDLDKGLKRGNAELAMQSLLRLAPDRRAAEMPRVVPLLVR